MRGPGFIKPGLALIHHQALFLGLLVEEANPTDFRRANGRVGGPEQDLEAGVLIFR